jgi:hypothetical protein
MNSKSPVINKFGVVALLFFVISAIFAGQYFLNGCLWWNCVPERDFHVAEMELPSSIFHNSVQISPINPSSEGAGEIDRGSQSIFWNNGNSSAGYDVNRYPTIKKAIQVYELDSNNMADSDTQKKWARPIELTYSSSTADQFLVACGNWAAIYHCGMLARYQEYEIFFRATIDDQMTYSDFEKVVAYIDKEISNRLYP